MSDEYTDRDRHARRGLETQFGLQPPEGEEDVAGRTLRESYERTAAAPPEPLQQLGATIQRGAEAGADILPPAYPSWMFRKQS